MSQSCCKRQRLNNQPDGEPNQGPDERPESIFRRLLPIPPAIASFDSERGIEIFSRALKAGTLKCYFALAQQFRTQDEPAYCGISTLVMVLNTFKADSMNVWKGPWRFYQEDMLNCCKPLEQVKRTGIEISQFLCLAKCNGAVVKKFVRGGEGTLEDFRQVVKEASMTFADKTTLVMSYSRKEFKQTGDGHYSTMGGYSEEDDALLIMDVARFKYPPHWVKVEDMWKAMQRLDPDTQKPRGYMLLAPSFIDTNVLFTFRTNLDSWDIFSKFFSTLGEELDSSKGDNYCKDNGICCGGLNKDHEESKFIAVYCFFKCMPPQVCHALTTYAEEYNFNSLPYRPIDRQEEMKKIEAQVKTTLAYKLTKKALEQLDRKNQNVVLSTILLMAFPKPERVCSQFKHSESLSEVSDTSGLLQTEVSGLRTQIRNMMSTDNSK